MAHNRPCRPQNAPRVYAQCAHSTTRSAPGVLKARAVAWLAVARRWPNLGMVYTASFPSPWCTHLTRLRALAYSEESGRRRGGTHRRGRRHQMALVVGGSRARHGKLLRGGWVLWDLPRKKGGGWLRLAVVSRSRKQGRKWWHSYRWTAKPVAWTKYTGKVPFIAAWAEGGWDG
jgi:hypothetical protein